MKPSGQRQRRNRTAGATTIEAGPATQPELPARTWHARTLETWRVWWASPIAQEWVDADIPGLIETLTLVDDFWQADSAFERAKMRSEIRLSSREYGLSSFSRRQLQWEVKRLGASTPAAAPRETVPSRSRLSVLQGRAG